MNDSEYWRDHFAHAAGRCVAGLDLPPDVATEIEKRVETELKRLARDSRHKIMAVLNEEWSHTISRVNHMYGYKPE